MAIPKTHRIALLGKGKTGGQVLELLRQQGRPVTVFDSTHPPDERALQGHAALVAFVPGPVLAPYLPLILKSGLPLVSGATGFTWPEGICEDLIKSRLTWVHANNFSLGMVAVKAALEALARSRHILPEARALIHEVHHTKKLDAPSGTALSWREWLGPGFQDIPVTSAREGDVVGFHQFTLETGSESIRLSHQAHDRKLFAEGAVWTLDQLLAGRIPPGLHQFSDIATQFLFKDKT